MGLDFRMDGTYSSFGCAILVYLLSDRKSLWCYIKPGKKKKKETVLQVQAALAFGPCDPADLMDLEVSAAGGGVVWRLWQHV